jgi:hypothetical protein
MSNLCTNCGSERIISKTWTETIELYGKKTDITHSEYVCKDVNCQKQVDKQLTDQKNRRAMIEKNKEDEKVARAKRLLKAKEENMARVKSL